MRHFVWILAFFTCYVGAVERSLFNNPDISTEYSSLLQEKNARNDSLLPALDGDKAFAELLRTIPSLWSLDRWEKMKSFNSLKSKDYLYRWYSRRAFVI